MLLHRKATKAQQANRAAVQTATQVSSQIAEPVLHVARWSMIVALAAWLVGCTALGFALYATFRG